jgi:cyclin-dependent kinase-like
MGASKATKKGSSMYKLDEGRSPFTDLAIGVLPQLEAVKLETPRAARTGGQSKRISTGAGGAGGAGARRGGDDDAQTRGAANLSTRTTARVTAKQIVFPDLDNLAQIQPAVQHRHRHHQIHQSRRPSVPGMNPATTRAAPSSSVRTTELKPGRRRADPIARITGRSGAAKPAGIANYKPSVAALEISRMHAPGSRRARELAAREGLARATADVGRVPDVNVVESLTNAIRAAEATGRPGEGHSGFIAAGLLSRAANELRAATRREEARADLAAAAAEGRASAGAVRRALALGIAGTDPAVRAMDEAVRVAEAEREREAAAAAAELRREIEGSGAEPTLARSPDNEGEDGTHAEDPEDGTLVSSTERVLRDDLEVLGTVGEGAYGVVMRCRDRVTGETVAVKEFKINSNDPDVEEVRRTSTREVTVLRALSHPNIVAYLGDFYVGEKLYVAMEYLPRTLLEILDDTNGRGLPAEDVRLYIHQLCRAVAFMHARGYVYRDVKPENLLVGDDGVLKLCDFGFARELPGTDPGVPGGGAADANTNAPLTDYVATRWYRAPELLLGQPYRAADGVGGVTRAGYGQPVDMWAVGCLAGELRDGEPMFPGENDVDQLRLVQRCLGRLTPGQMMAFSVNPHNAGVTFPEEELGVREESLAARYGGVFDDVALDFVQGLLELNPKKRRTGAACLEHPYFRGLD